MKYLNILFLLISFLSFSQDKINTIDKKPIYLIRQEYNIPNDIKFELLMTHINYTSLFNKSSATPRSQDNVFVKRWRDYIIAPDGEKELVLMGVRVWQ